MKNTQLIFGKNTITETIKNDKKQILNLYIQKDTSKDIVQLATKNNIEITYLDKEQMNKLVSSNHQGVICEIYDYKYYDLSQIISNDNHSLIIALDGIEDPHNLGAIMRTSEISKVDGIIIPKNRSCKVTASASKVSTGASEYVKVSQVVNLRQALKKLKDEGYWIVGAEYTEKSIDMWKANFDMKICLVIGSEGKGVSRIVREECDFLVKIPMWGKINSLNASVSCAVLIYEIRRQQNK